jgi:hypothetical protein
LRVAPAACFKSRIFAPYRGCAINPDIKIGIIRIASATSIVLPIG